jgi:release factor glutamine methyltransferase
VATIADATRILQSAFAEAGISSARLDAELLIGHALGIDRTALLAKLQEEVPYAAGVEIERLAKRRLNHEPVAYLTGAREFYGREFIVSPAVLVPRPETEMLVEWALAWLAARPTAHVIDVGTGSGAISISIAAEAPDSTVTATDISANALEVARTNAARLCPDRVIFRQADLIEGVEGRFELIVANLPYLRNAQINGNLDIGAEPRLALDGGPDGLALISRLVRQAPQALAPTGAIGLELDPSQAETVARSLSDSLPGAQVEIHQDLAGLDRFVTGVRI